MYEIAHQKCLLGYFLFAFFQRKQPRSLNRFSHTIVKRRGSVQGCASSGLEDQNITCIPSYSRKLPFLGPLLTGLKFFSTENHFIMGITLLHIPVMSMSCRVISPF